MPKVTKLTAYMACYFLQGMLKSRALRHIFNN